MTFITYGEPGIGEPDDDTLWGSDDTELVKVGLAPDEGLREITIADTWKSKIPSDDLGSAVTSAYMAAVLALVTAREDGEVAMEAVALPPAGSGAAAATAEIDFSLVQKVAEEQEDYMTTYEELLSTDLAFVSDDGNVTVTARGGSPSLISFDAVWLGFADARHIAQSTREALTPALESGRVIEAEMRSRFPATMEFRRLRQLTKAARGC